MQDDALVQREGLKGSADKMGTYLWPMTEADLVCRLYSQYKKQYFQLLPCSFEI